MIKYRAPTPEDLDYIAAMMRDADRAEIEAQTGIKNVNVRRVLDLSVQHSSHCWVGEEDGVPFAVFGVSPDGDSGAPWLLGTDRLYRRAKQFVKDGKRYTAEMQAAYPRLENYVHADNVAAVRWLRYLGYTVHPAQPAGPQGKLFHRFERCCHV